MRFITVNVQCDRDGCETIAEEGDGLVAPMTLSIDGKRGKEFLLCKPHREELDEVLLPLMAAGIAVEAPGRKTSAKTSAAKTSVGGTVADDSSSGSSAQPPPPLPDHAEVPDGLRCKHEADGSVCGRPMRNRAGFAQHAVRSHGYKNLADYEAVYGTVG